MKVVLCTATDRGVRFLETLRQVCPDCEIDIFTFPEKPWEPPFVDRLRDMSQQTGSNFHFVENGKIHESDYDWDAINDDVLFAVSWRYLIPEHVYTRFNRGAFVFHDSYLPEYRGFSPTVWSILNGEHHTGATLFEMTKNADEGDVIERRKVPIEDDDTIADVLENVTKTYLEILQNQFPNLRNGEYIAIPQDHDNATYCARRSLDDNQIKWERSAAEIYNLIRAVTRPYPGAYTYLNGEKVTIWSSSKNDISADGEPGEVVSQKNGNAVVRCGEGSLIVNEVAVDGVIHHQTAEIFPSATRFEKEP